MDDKGMLIKIDPIQPNTILSCQLRRVDFCGKTIQLLSFIRNNEFVGAWVIEGTNLMPKITFSPKGEDTGHLEIKTDLGSWKNCSSIGELIGTVFI